MSPHQVEMLQAEVPTFICRPISVDRVEAIALDRMVPGMHGAEFGRTIARTDVSNDRAGVDFCPSALWRQGL
jgi:hypothetical protein